MSSLHLFGHVTPALSSDPSLPAAQLSAAATASVAAAIDCSASSGAGHDGKPSAWSGGSNQHQSTCAEPGATNPPM